jgi:hypothetical protein
MCPQIRVWNDLRAKLLRARWREHPDLEFWRRYFAHVRSCPFLTGPSTYSRDGPPFFATLEWLIRPKNFANVVEGKYDD